MLTLSVLILHCTLYELAPLVGKGDGALGCKVEADNHRLALGIGLSVGKVYKPLVHSHTLIAEALHPSFDFDIVAKAGLTHHIGLDAHKHQVYAPPINPLAQNRGIELHLSEVEILLQVDVVDVAQRVGIGKTLLYFCPDNHRVGLP